VYTQCPECGAAFRVTAQALKQAAGTVRCGSCSATFNALDYLSEQRPAPKQPAIPELKPEPVETESAATAETPSGPQSISAEQSAALMKTLDELAGEDFRVEDTGVEWRVIDESDGDQDEAPSDDALLDPDVTNAFKVADLEDAFELDSESPSSVDEMPQDGEATASNVLTTPVDEAHIFDGGETSTDVDELLPEIPGAADPRISDAPVSASHDVFNLEALDAEAAVSAPEDELRFDDNTPLPDDLLDDDDEPQAVAPTVATTPAVSMEPQDVALGNADEWQALLDDFGDLLATDLRPDEITSEPADPEAEDRTDEGELAVDEAVDEASDEHVEVAPDEVIVGDGVSTSDSDNWATLDVADDASDIGADAEAAAIDEAIEARSDGETLGALDVLAEAARPDEHIEATIGSAADAHSTAESVDASTDNAADESIELAADALADDLPAADEEIPVDAIELEAATETEDEPFDLTAILDADDEQLLDDGEHDREIDDAALPEIHDVGDSAAAPDADDEPKPRIPGETEEEATINRLIDRDLLAIAHEDEDGFASTIVFETKDDSLDVDAIIMGSEADTKADDAIADDEPTVLAVDAPEAASVENEGGTGRRVALIAAAALLVFSLGAQVIHQYRQELATQPAFAPLIEAVYGSLGIDVTPNWNVDGWRFESTRESLDDSGRMLTIVAKLGNAYDRPLPYPLVTVSVTDRYQEPIGSLVLEPGDYLNGSAADAVAPKETVEAVIPIADLSTEAASYVLNACYRRPDGALRCATEDFR